MSKHRIHDRSIIIRLSHSTERKHCSHCSLCWRQRGCRSPTTCPRSEHESAR